MVRAIAAFTVVVLLSIGGVLVHLWLNRPARISGETPVRRPLINTERDGSLYAVTLKHDVLEQRLMDSEQLSVQLTQELAAVRQGQQELADKLDQVAEELGLIREQLVAPYEFLPGEPLAPGPVSSGAPVIRSEATPVSR